MPKKNNAQPMPCSDEQEARTETIKFLNEINDFIKNLKTHDAIDLYWQNKDRLDSCIRKSDPKLQEELLHQITDANLSFAKLLIGNAQKINAKRSIEIHKSYINFIADIELKGNPNELPPYYKDRVKQKTLQLAHSYQLLEQNHKEPLISLIKEYQSIPIDYYFSNDALKQWEDRLHGCPNDTIPVSTNPQTRIQSMNHKNCREYWLFFRDFLAKWTKDTEEGKKSSYFQNLYQILKHDL